MRKPQPLITSKWNIKWNGSNRMDMQEHETKEKSASEAKTQATSDTGTAF